MFKRLLGHWGLIGLSIVEILSLELFRSNELKKSNLSSEQKSHFAMNKKYLSPSTSTLFHFTTTINRFLRRALAWCRTLWPILHLIELHSMTGLRKYLTTKCLTIFGLANLQMFLAQNYLKLEALVNIQRNPIQQFLRQGKTVKTQQPSGLIRSRVQYMVRL